MDCLEASEMLRLGSFPIRPLADGIVSGLNIRVSGPPPASCTTQTLVVDLSLAGGHVLGTDDLKSLFPYTTYLVGIHLGSITPPLGTIY